MGRKGIKFEELIDKIIEDFLGREAKEREVGVYYPSELPFCVRRNFFLYKKPKEVELFQLKLFEAGNLIHNWFKEVVFKSYMTSNLLKDFSYEGSLKYKGDGFTISGRYDDVILIEWEKEPILIEIKTMRDLRFLTEVKRHHLLQTNFYLNVLKLERGFIIYFERKTLQHKIFEIKKSKELFDEILKRAKELHKHLKENKIPLAEAKFDKKIKWMCNYCQYRLECLRAE